MAPDGTGVFRLPSFHPVYGMGFFPAVLSPETSILDPRAKEFHPKGTQMISYSCFFAPPTAAASGGFTNGGGSGGGFFPATARETASRGLLITWLPAGTTETSLKRDMEMFGPVRVVEMTDPRFAAATVHFFDVRDAQKALVEIQHQHMLQQSRLGHHYNAVTRFADGRNPPVLLLPSPVLQPATAHVIGIGRGLVGGCAVWAQYSSAPIRSRNGSMDGLNQGTLVVFNLDADVSASKVKEVFEQFGPVKELRETPAKRQHRFVEFFDIRDAARALTEMNGREICGKRVKIEFSRPGGQAKRLLHSASAPIFSNFPNTYKAINTNLSPPPSFNANPPPPLFSHFRPCNPSGTILAMNSNKNPPGFVARSISNRSASAVNCGSRSTFPSSIVGGRYFSGEGYFSKMKVRTIESGGAFRKFESGHCYGGGGDCWVGGGGGGLSRVHGQSGLSFDVRNLESDICNNKKVDNRTTVMIKNIPNKYSQKLLLNLLDQHCISCNEQNIVEELEEEEQYFSAYDFVYLPIDFKNKCNVGYGFVNMTTPEGAVRLYKAFHRQPWEAFNSRKICEVTYARLQGLEALKDHFRNSKFACETDDYLPVLFDPPRDGKNHVSDPIPVGGRHSNRMSSNYYGISKHAQQTSFIVAVDRNNRGVEGNDDHHVGLSTSSPSSSWSGGGGVLQENGGGGGGGDDDDDHAVFEMKEMMCAVDQEEIAEDEEEEEVIIVNFEDDDDDDVNNARSSSSTRDLNVMKDFPTPSFCRRRMMMGGGGGGECEKGGGGTGGISSCVAAEVI